MFHYFFMRAVVLAQHLAQALSGLSSSGASARWMTLGDAHTYADRQAAASQLELELWGANMGTAGFDGKHMLRMRCNDCTSRIDA